MKNTFTLICGISLAMVTAGSALADSAKFDHLASQDRKFVEAAIEGSRTDTQLGQLAAQNAASPAVRDYGMRMAQENQMSGEQLARVLEQKGITEVAPSEKYSRMTAHLENETGINFDKAYLKDAIKGQKNEIAEYKKEAADGKDPELKSYAEASLPVLEEHLKLAEQTQADLAK